MFEKELFIALVILAITDYLLTMLWNFRWADSAYVAHFRYKIPFRLIEANPVIRYLVKTGGENNRYFMITTGYVLVFVLQLVLLDLHWVLGLFVCGTLAAANGVHIVNNLKTSNKHIIAVTMKYNERMRKNGG